jgi:hypothetical protein
LPHDRSARGRHCHRWQNVAAVRPRNGGSPAIQIVSAFAAGQRLVLGPLKVEKKSNEIIAIQSYSAKLQADYGKSGLVAIPAAITVTDSRQSVGRPLIMLHLRARGFAPLRRRSGMSLK